jgi:cystathionine beta-lyase family protein involved in aluminum resistance
MPIVKNSKKEVVLQVDNNKFETFLDFIKTLEYVDVINENQQALTEFELSLNQVKLMQQGLIPKQTAQEFLDEL